MADKKLVESSFESERFKKHGVFGKLKLIFKIAFLLLNIISPFTIIHLILQILRNRFHKHLFNLLFCTFNAYLLFRFNILQKKVESKTKYHIFSYQKQFPLPRTRFRPRRTIRSTCSYSRPSQLTQSCQSFFSCNSIPRNLWIIIYGETI